MFDYNNYTLTDEKVDEDGRPVFYIRSKFIDDWHCPTCGCEKIRVRGTFPRKVFDLTPDKNKATIDITNRRYMCPECHTQYDPWPVDYKETYSQEFRDYIGQEGIRRGLKDVADDLDVGRTTMRMEIDRNIKEYNQNRKVIPPYILIVGVLKIKQGDRYVAYDAGRERVVDIFPDRESLDRAIAEWKPVRVLNDSKVSNEALSTDEISEREARKLGISEEEWQELLQGEPDLTRIQKYGKDALRLYVLTKDLLNGKEADPALLDDFPAFKNPVDLEKKEEAYQMEQFDKWLTQTQESINFRSRYDAERVRILMAEDEKEDE